MPPTLRSSPAGTRITRNSTKVATPEQLPSTPGTPRYCTSCKRPRKGHPRKGCPFADPSILDDSPTRSVADTLDALDALSLAGPDDDAGVDEEAQKKPRKRFTPMPGSLLTTAPSWMYSESSQASKEESPPPDASFSSSIPYLGLSQTSYSTETQPVSSQRTTPPPTRPLMRTLTSEERAAFTTSLTHLAKATVYVLPASDVPAICAAAAERGLHTRTLPLDHADTLLIVGHTAAAVDVLVYQVEAKMHSLVPPPPQGTTLSTAATAVAVGAVAAWSALAFI
ncbi:hypothetical protein K438DRAFT_1840375 [Mycena galopus ATCC 62051]|nr:hypothetical protein K438DRAFT_1840375 [Mycena galopus ATCC 62051]